MELKKCASYLLCAVSSQTQRTHRTRHTQRMQGACVKFNAMHATLATQGTKNGHGKHLETRSDILHYVACVTTALTLCCMRCVRRMRCIKFYASTLRCVRCVWLETAPRAFSY